MSLRYRVKHKDEKKERERSKERRFYILYVIKRTVKKTEVY